MSDTPFTRRVRHRVEFVLPRPVDPQDLKAAITNAEHEAREMGQDPTHVIMDYTDTETIVWFEV